MRQFHRQRIRLPLARYADHGAIWHVTMATLNRRETLTIPALATDLIDCLRTACSNASAELLMYCVMPDHLHALIQIDEVDLIATIRNYKSFSTKIWWSHGGAGKLWQRSAYDRGVRLPDHLDDLLRYLFENPAEIGDIAEWQRRGLLGGTLLDEGV